jgi:hypothetical protein
MSYRQIVRVIETWLVIVLALGALTALIGMVVTAPRHLRNWRIRRRGGTPPPMVTSDQAMLLIHGPRGREIVRATRFADRTRTPEAYYSIALLWDEVIEEQPNIADFARKRRADVIEKAERAKAAQRLAGE